MRDRERGARPMMRRAVAALVLCAATGCGARASSDDAPVLVFAGAGTSTGDVAAVERILEQNHLEYATATSAQLNAMSPGQLMAHRLIVVPGGNFIDMAASLTPRATANVREAVQGGVSYLGICAGAFLAGNGGAYYNSLDLAAGARFDFYGAGQKGTRKAIVRVTGADGSAVEHYWEDGPQLSGWGTVIGRYPDGTPAIVQGTSGKGWVILAGVHPEAPESWRRGMTFTTPASVANAYAGTLVNAALNRSELPHF